MTQETTYLLYLDDYHAADTLFLQSLARALTQRANSKIIIIHGSGEHAERLLEAEGIFRTRSGGVVPLATPREHAIVDLAVRQMNRKLVATLTEAVVSTVGIIGTQRRLFSMHAGRIRAGDVSWLHSLLHRGVIPVVAAYAREHDSNRVGEISVSDATIGMAGAFGNAPVAVVFFTKTNLPGLMRSGRPIPEIAVGEANDPRIIPDAEGLRQVVQEGLPVLLTNTTRFADAAGPVGTWITPQ